MPTIASRRMPLSCEPCRERKIRCPRNTNRGKGPCETCVRRGIPPDECVYLKDLFQQRQRTELRQPDNSELLARISKLEQLLETHVAKDRPRTSSGSPIESHIFPSNPNLQPASTSGQDFPAEHCSISFTGIPSPALTVSSLGTLVQSKSGHERFEPSTSRWSSLLMANPVTRELKTDISGGEDGSFPFTTITETSINFLHVLPPLSPCDELKDLFFHVYAPLFHILHNPTFEAAYAQFREDQAQVSLSWLALLFSILSVAVSAVPEDVPLLRELGHRRTASENMSLLCNRYRSAAMKCLEADHFLWRHNLQTLQALVILIYGINHTHGQSWALLGTARHIALSLGCHVDPDAFDLDLVVAEERRRCWAAVHMLYTIQNTTLGNLEPVNLPFNVKMPLDVNDDQLVPGLSQNYPQTGPSQMSYLLMKFELYGICNRICRSIFNHDHQPTYDIILQLDSEIRAQQDAFNNKYLLDTTASFLPAYHTVHLNILFGYSHQLTLLLHRPVLMQQAMREAGAEYTTENILASRQKCIDSSRALLGIHRMLHEEEGYKSYRWYTRGLGSFHAFHAVVCLAYIHGISTDLDAPTMEVLQNDIHGTITLFEQIKQSGMSPFCDKATPVLKTLVAMVYPPRTGHASCTGSSVSTELDIQAEIQNPNSSQLLSTYGKENQGASQGLGLLLGSLEPQQWLSSSTVNWTEWEALMDGYSISNGQ